MQKVKPQFFFISEPVAHSSHKQLNQALIPERHVCKEYKSFFGLFLFALIFCCMSIDGVQSQSLVINEFMASNSNIVADEDGEFSDWIEVLNIGDKSVNLDGFGLSDDTANLFRWIFPPKIIEPGEYILIWASGKDKVGADGSLHTSFSISSGGEELSLTAPDGSPEYALEAVVLPDNISYGLSRSEPAEPVFFNNPTPGFENHDEGFAGVLEPPSFSVISGFHQETLNLEISHNDLLAGIRYSTDASVPDHTSSEYSSALILESLEGVPDDISLIRTNPTDVPEIIAWKPPVTETAKAHVIRAVAVKPGYISSEVVTATYFIGHNLPSLPVFSIVTDNENLFDHENGIYIPGIVYEEYGYGDGWYGQLNANYFRRGEEWEIPAFLEFLEDGEPVVSQQVGVRIHGGGTRALPMKSLRLYARDSYGKDKIEHDFFPEQGEESYKTLILRNNGQDFFGYGTMMRDGLMHRLARPLGWAVQDQRPAILYLNGEYWGIHSIRERYDDHYFKRNYDIDEEELDFLESNQVVINGSADHYSDMISFVEQNPLSGPESYEHIKDLMDVENYIDFFIVNIFFNNIDWPGHNLKFWRYSGEQLNNPPDGKDGRWRWVFNDFDFGFGNTEGDYPFNWNTLVHATHPEGGEWPPNPPWSTFLIRSLLENPEFKNDFINRFGDLLNSIFLPEHTTAVIDDMKMEIETGMTAHINRWGHPTPGIEGWQANIDRMIEYAIQRPGHQVSHLIDYFELEGTFLLTVDVETDTGAGTVTDAGSVTVNRMVLKEGGFVPGKESGMYPWAGTYFKGIPLKIQALPEAGYEFQKWVSSTGEEFTDNPLQVDAQSDVSFTAVFGLQKTFFPEPFALKDSEYFLFDKWNSFEPVATFPDNMAFVYMNTSDPGPDASIEGYTGGGYDLESRSRINGLGCDGISVINTGSEDGNPGYPGGRMGGVILSLDTRGTENLHMMFQAGTIARNSQIYNIRLQYRLDDHSGFLDFHSPQYDSVVYLCSADGDSEFFGPFALPEYMLDQPVVQLLWRFYYTGNREDEESGKRSELRLDNIAVFQGNVFPDPDMVAEVVLNGPSGPVCSNDSIMLEALFKGNGNTVYDWYIDGEPVSAGSSSMIKLSAPDDGSSVKVIVSEPGSCLINMPSVSNEIELSISPAPETPTVIAGDTFIISSSEEGNQWYMEGGTLIPGEEGQMFVPEQDGNYYVIVSEGLCKSSPSEMAEFVVTSAGAGYEEPAGKYMAFPNPTGNNLTIRTGTASSKPGTWKLFNSLGKLMDSGVVPAGHDEINIDVSHLPGGIYLVGLSSGMENRIIRFIKN